MERMTAKKDGHVYVINCPPCDVPHDVNVIIQQTADRLAAYEDTGLEPEEIVKICEDIENGYMKSTARRYGVPVDRLRELVEMDSAGCIPPCKIGDVFYRVCYGFDSPEIEKYRVSMVTQKSDRSWRIRATDTEESFQIDWSLDDFSKRAYKTREEAEAALAKLNSET